MLRAQLDDMDQRFEEQEARHPYTALILIPPKPYTSLALYLSSSIPPWPYTSLAL